VFRNAISAVDDHWPLCKQVKNANRQGSGRMKLSVSSIVLTQKFDPLRPSRLSTKCPHCSTSLSVRTNHKFRKKSEVYCDKKCGRPHLNNRTGQPLTHKYSGWANSKPKPFDVCLESVFIHLFIAACTLTMS